MSLYGVMDVETTLQNGVCMEFFCFLCFLATLDKLCLQNVLFICIACAKSY